MYLYEKTFLQLKLGQSPGCKIIDIVLSPAQKCLQLWNFFFLTQIKPIFQEIVCAVLLDK